MEVVSTCNKSDLFKYIEDRKSLFSKIESGQCELNSLLQSIEAFHNLSGKIMQLSTDCLSSRLITKSAYNEIRNETNEMYSRIKKIVNKSLKEKCNVEWYAV